MANLKKTLIVFFVSVAACFHGPAAPADDAVQGLRIGVIGADPGRLLHDFDPLAQLLRSSLLGAGIRDVTLFVAKDLKQMRALIQEGKLDFILTSAFPIIEMERHEIVPAVVALYGADREESAVFFVGKQSSVQSLSDLHGMTIVFGTPSSTAAYAMALAELKKNGLFLSRSADHHARGETIGYTFAGEAINQAVLVIRNGADAGVFSSSEWEKLSPKAQSRLRIIHRTAPIIRLLGSFHPSFPQATREVVEKVLIDLSGNWQGRTALATALNITAFERLTEEDRNSLQRLKQELSEAGKR